MLYFGRSISSQIRRNDGAFWLLSVTILDIQNDFRWFQVVWNAKFLVTWHVYNDW